MHGARNGSGRGVDGGDGAGQLGQPGVVRSEHELPPDPVPALEVDDDPGGELGGDQAGASLQGPGLAEALILEQQPGHRGDQVKPPGDGLNGAQPGTVTARAVRLIRLAAGRAVTGRAVTGRGITGCAVTGGALTGRLVTG